MRKDFSKDIIEIERKILGSVFNGNLHILKFTKE